MSDNTSLILAAVNTVGARVDNGNGPSWEDQVLRAAEDIVILSNPEGRFVKKLEAFRETKPFVAVVAEVGIESTSKRGFVGLASETQGKNKGFETIRTERTDSDVIARDMVNQLAKLRGHRVLVYKRMDTTKNDTKVRILHRFEDLGMAPAPLIDSIRDNLREASTLVLASATLVSN